MPIDARTPVIVGVAQLSQHEDAHDAREPVDLMADAGRAAALDCGKPAILDALDSVRVVNLLSWHYRDPAALVAAQLGAARDHVETVYTEGGGQIVGTLLARTADDIAAGALDVALLTGAEAWRTRTAYRRAGEPLPWTEQPEGVAPDRMVGAPLDMWHPAEVARGITTPVQVYPLFESALRAAAGRGLAEHSRFLGELWARFNAVAVRNPDAWDHTAYTAEQIATPSRANRMVGFPYTKLLCSNEQVDQAAALLMCSAERADALGIARDRWVFPRAASEARAPNVSERPDLATSPLVRAVGDALWKLTGVGPDDVAHVDLYSCFPSAVELQAAELGVDLGRDLTVTGGMRFAGGPWNNYPMHAVATMTNVLRGDAGALGLVCANGGYVTKLALCLLSSDPAPDGFRSVSAQDAVEAAPRCGVEGEPDGVATVQASTVMHDRGGEPTDGILACMLPDGRRAWGTVKDPAALGAMEREETVGRTATLRPDGTATIE
ncbi:MAG TPA: acetyl-CoA acetyltransferase [Acidimicrobiia bacterium]|nr:acetyl-CoA acetyltransferase [Acidimicrobiia bacterium]